MESYIVSVLLLILIVLLTYQIRIDSHTREKMFEIQMKMGEAQAATTKELPWSELKKIIDEIINFTASNYIMINGIDKMNKDELAINWTYMLEEMSTNVELSLSNEIRRQILKNISKEYMSRYITNSVQLVVVYKLQYKKNNPVNDKINEIHQGINNLSNKK